MHSARLKQMGVDEVRGVIFDVNQPLTTINKRPNQRLIKLVHSLNDNKDTESLSHK